MHINTNVVMALMALRNVSVHTLANLAHVTVSDMTKWLEGEDESSEDIVSFDTQLEILKMLGISGDSPRPDIVHYWSISEKFFSSKSSTYFPLLAVLRTFGPAQIAFIARQADPAFTFKSKFHYALKFGTFMAILEITGSPFKALSFDPSDYPELSWVPETMGILLPPEDYDKLQPGAFKVSGMTQYLTYSTEVSQWDKLRDAAFEKGLRADQVATLLLGRPLSEMPQALPHHAKGVAPAARTAPKEVPTANPITDSFEVIDDTDLFSKPIDSSNK